MGRPPDQSAFNGAICHVSHRIALCHAGSFHQIFVSSLEQINLCNTHGPKLSDTGPAQHATEWRWAQLVVVVVSD
jgi:hypothetical protein